MTLLDEPYEHPGDRPAGMHRVRIIRPADRLAHYSMAYMVEVDGQAIYPTSLTLSLAPGSTPVVTLEIPAVVENTEIIALLARESSTEDDDEPLAPSRFEEC